MDVKNKFILLRKVKYGEADLILQALSPKGEKMSFMARGALRSRKRFGGGVLEPGNFVMINYTETKSGGMPSIKEASLVNDFAGLRKDYDRLAFALKVIDCVGKVSLEGDSSSEFLFNLLGHTLKALENAKNILPIQFQFWLKLLSQQGVLTAEDWMRPFLKANLAGFEKLQDVALSEQRRIPGLEMMVEDYLKNAAVEGRG